MAEQGKERQTIKIETDGSSYQTVEIDKDKITLLKIGTPGDHEILEGEKLESGKVEFRIINNLKHDNYDPDTGDLEWVFYEAARSTVTFNAQAAKVLREWLEERTG